MTQMGLDYQKYKESQRHNYVTEDVSRREVATKERDVGVKEYNASFEPYRVGATVTQAKASATNAQASATNASTNRYLASFEPRRVASTEKQASASMKQANVQAARYQLDSSWREYEENLKFQELELRNAKNEIDKYIAQLNALPSATKAALASAGLNLDGVGASMAAVESGMDKGASYFNTLMSGLKALGSQKTTKKK